MASMRVGGIPSGLRAGPPAALQLAWGSFRDISALIGSLTSDLGAIVAATQAMEESTRVLPNMNARLEAIEERVTSMDSEVKRMRRGVDVLQTEIEHVRGHTEPLGRLAGRLGRSGRTP